MTYNQHCPSWALSKLRCSSKFMHGCRMNGCNLNKQQLTEASMDKPANGDEAATKMQSPNLASSKVPDE